MTVTIYVEGGGNSNHTKTECRKGFRVFLSKLLPNKQKPKIIASGGRSEAYRDFQTALKTLRGGVHILLLVNSEDPIDVGDRSVGPFSSPAGRQMGQAARRA